VSSLYTRLRRSPIAPARSLKGHLTSSHRQSRVSAVGSVKGPSPRRSGNCRDAPKTDRGLRLGVGVGWNWVEFDGLEMSRHFRRRGKRQEQQIALIRKLWQEPVVEYEDSDHRIDRAGILPRPKRQIPIWLGGFSEAAYDRAARIGEGFLFSGRTQTEAIQIKARIAAKLLELGRDADAFGFESIQQYSRGDNQWPGDIAAWREAGGSHISVVTMGANLNTVDGHIKAIKRWRDVYNSAG